MDKDDTKKNIDAYDKGLRDAWEVAQKLFRLESNGGYPWSLIRELYNISDMNSIIAIIEDHDIKDVMKKIKAYEDKQKQDLKVGDEVVDEFNYKAIVVSDTYSVGDDKYTLIWYGGHMASRLVKNLTKTGRHFEQVSELLKELRGEE